MKTPSNLRHFLHGVGACLAEKRLAYATGRELGFGDRREVEHLVKQVKEDGDGFQDLIVALVLSKSFWTK